MLSEFFDKDIKSNLYLLDLKKSIALISLFLKAIQTLIVELINLNLKKLMQIKNSNYYLNTFKKKCSISAFAAINVDAVATLLQ